MGFINTDPKTTPFYMSYIPGVRLMHPTYVLHGRTFQATSNTFNTKISGKICLPVMGLIKSNAKEAGVVILDSNIMQGQFGGFLNNKALEF
jgi:hypothetical protein